MNPTEPAVPQAALQETPAAPQAAPKNNLNAPSAQPTAAVNPKPEPHNNPAPDTQRTDPAPDPAAYADVKWPEDFPMPESAAEELKSTAREMGLTSEQVQKLVDLEARYARSGAQQSEEEKRQIVERWADQTKAFYGPRLGEAIALAVRAADAFGGPELRELLQATGLGNHPVIVRTFNEIGKCISEDCLPGGKPAAPQDKTFAEALYGKNN